MLTFTKGFLWQSGGWRKRLVFKSFILTVISIGNIIRSQCFKQKCRGVNCECNDGCIPFSCFVSRCWACPLAVVLSWLQAYLKNVSLRKISEVEKAYPAHCDKASIVRDCCTTAPDLVEKKNLCDRAVTALKIILCCILLVGSVSAICSDVDISLSGHFGSVSVFSP